MEEGGLTNEKPFEITRAELTQLNIDLQLLGVGTVNHIMFGSLQSLEFVMADVEDKGWTDTLRARAKELSTKVRNHIFVEKWRKARAAGLG